MADSQVTVLYFDSLEILTMKRAVLSDLPESTNGRRMLPDDFRDGKVIVAVMAGDVEVLSMTGERTLPLPSETAAHAAVSLVAC